MMKVKADLTTCSSIIDYICAGACMAFILSYALDFNPCRILLGFLKSSRILVWYSKQQKFMLVEPISFHIKE